MYSRSSEQGANSRLSDRSELQSMNLNSFGRRIPNSMKAIQFTAHLDAKLVSNSALLQLFRIFRNTDRH